MAVIHLVAKITFVSADIIIEVAVIISSSLAKITFVVAEIYFESRFDHFFNGQDHFCSG